MQAFHKAFLGSIAWHGRLHEIGMLMNYKVRTGHLLQDMTLAPSSIRRANWSCCPTDRGQGGSEAHVPAQYWR